MAENLSLFGWPLKEPKEGAGRPEHEPTNENRNKIMMLLAIGNTIGDVAAAVGLSTKTLRKHYSPLLEARRVARLQLDAQLWAALYQKAIGGDVSAMKELGKRLDKHDLAELADKFGAAPRQQRAAKSEKLGKKEIAQREAETAGVDSEWGDDLLPSTRVN